MCEKADSPAAQGGGGIGLPPGKGKYMDLLDVTVGGIPMQISPQMRAAGVHHGFTTRQGGVSTGIYASLNLGKNRGDDIKNVRENYARVCSALGADRDKLVFSNQVHGSAVRVVTAGDAGKGLDRPVDYEADGLVTNVEGLVLTAFGADCLTVLLYDPVERAVGAVHAGWRGTTENIVGQAVQTMEEAYGTRPENLIAALGPCISKCCFETGPDVPEALCRKLGEDVMSYISGPNEAGKFLVDLRSINALLLQKTGVLGKSVDLSLDCTLCKSDKYWSHRYTKGERGSQAALIVLL